MDISLTAPDVGLQSYILLRHKTSRELSADFVGKCMGTNGKIIAIAAHHFKVHIYAQH